MSAMQHQSGAVCPSCGRFVGPLEKCPFCGANIRKRLPLKYLRLACLILALAGIAILLYAVSGASTPTAKIGSVGATMNFAYVKIQGVVTRGPIYDAEQQSLRLYVADATGEIQASAFRDVTQALVANKRVPMVGDAIVVEGTLRIRDDFSALYIASADKVQITPPLFSDTALSQIDPGDELKPVRVRGDIREIRVPYEGLTLITVGDAEGELEIALTGDTEALHGALPLPARGDMVEVQGIVANFRAAPQLLLRHPADLKKLDVENTTATTTNIGEIDAARVNQRVRVSGVVTRVAKFSQGVRATIADASGEIILLLWQDVYAQLANHAELKTGAQAEVLGKVAEYRGEMEIVPDRGEDVKISPLAAQAVTPPETRGAALPTNTVAPTTSTALPTNTVAPTTSTALPTNTVAPTTPTALPTQTVAPTTSTALPINTIAAITSTALPINTIAPTTSTTLPTNTVAPTATPRPTRIPTPAPVQVQIGGLTKNDVAQRVIVTAKIVRATGFSRGMRYTLDDDTSTILMILWTNVLEGVAVRDQLEPGATVRVAGSVELFNEQLEIIPGSASDVALVSAAPVLIVTVRPIDSITTEDLDETVVIEGTVTELTKFSAGQYATVENASGTIRVTVFDHLLKRIQAQLDIGARVRVEGKVNVFRGNLEIVANVVTFP